MTAALLLGFALCAATPPPAVSPPAEAPTASSTPSPSPALAAPERRVVRIAVNDFAVTDVDPRIAGIVTESFVFELRKLERVNVISFEEVRQMLNLEAERQAMGCEDEQSCLAQIADALGVDYLITGSLAKVGDTHVIGLRRLNQAQALGDKTVNKVLPAGNGVEFLGEIGPAVEVLFDDIPLKAGAIRGISPEVARRITPPPLPPLLTLGAASVGGVLLIGSGVAGVFQLGAQADYRAIADRSKTSVESGATLVAAGESAATAEVVGWSLLGAAVLVGGLAAAMIPLTDFEGLGDAR